MRPHTAIAAVLAAFASPTVAQDAYVVDITVALTGPAASTYAPAVEAMRIRAGGRPAGAGG